MFTASHKPDCRIMLTDLCQAVNQRPIKYCLHRKAVTHKCLLLMPACFMSQNTELEYAIDIEVVSYWLIPFLHIG